MPKLFYKARDPVSCYTHFIGVALSTVGLAAMSMRLLFQVTPPLLALACLLFCLSLLALYGASSLYHYTNASAKVQLILRKLDHAMIYVLIAGTYTPLLLIMLPPTQGGIFTGCIWAFAAGGILMKLRWMDAPRWLGTLLYLMMGWAIMVRPSALASLPTSSLSLLIAGGVFYTVGGVIYGLKHPNLSPGFGFHELFHLFVLGGSICHYFMVLSFVL